MLDAKVKKPQFRKWYVKEIFGNKIYPGTAAEEDLSKIDKFLLIIPPNQIDLIIKLTNHNLAESGKKLLTKSMLFICFGIIVLLTCCDVRNRRRLWDKRGSGNTFPLLNLTGLGLNIGYFRIFGNI